MRYIGSTVRAFGLLGILLTFAKNYACSDTLDEPYEDLKAKMPEVIARINRLSEANGFAIRAEAPKTFRFQTLPVTDYKVPALKVNDPNASQFVFNLETHAIVSFQNWVACDASFGEGSALFGKLPAATWTKSQAVHAAEEYAEIFFPDLSKETALTAAVFKESYLDHGKYREGQWNVVFNRISPMGYRFLSDNINVQISEKVGPLGIGIMMPSHYREGDFKPITGSEALKAAQPAFKVLFSTSVFKSWLGGPTVVKEASNRGLWIVNPNLRGSEWTSEPSLEARLAWVIEEVIQGHPLGSVQQTLSPQPARVYVDAQDGKVLGGEF